MWNMLQPIFILEFVLLALEEGAVYVLMCLSLHVHVCGSRWHFCTDSSAASSRFCMQILANAVGFWTAPGRAFWLMKKKRVPHFLTCFLLSYLAISATLGCIQRSWTPGQRKSDHPLPPPTPSCCSLRWGIALPSQDTPFALYQPHWTLSRSHMASVSSTANLVYLLMKTLPVFSFCRSWNPAASWW